MSIFDWFKPKKPTYVAPTTASKPNRDPAHTKQYDRTVYSDTDFLGMAANAKHDALAAIKAKDFDTAWKHLHEQKGFYLQHANRVGFTPQQTVALDATVEENMANILRMEGKHQEAFVHILYWVTSSSGITKNKEKKLLAYYRRAKFPEIGLMDVHQFIEDNSPMPDYREIQNAVKVWSEATKD